jgi:hypothetical protein
MNVLLYLSMYINIHASSVCRPLLNCNRVRDSYDEGCILKRKPTRARARKVMAVLLTP